MVHGVQLLHTLRKVFGAVLLVSDRPSMTGEMAAYMVNFSGNVFHDLLLINSHGMLALPAASVVLDSEEF